MENPEPSIGQTIIRVCSRCLLWVGAAIFLIGGKVLYEVKHMSFAVSETIGILGGILLMLVGAGIAIAGKPPRVND